MSPLTLERIDDVPIAHVNDDIDAANVTTTQQQLADALGPDASSLVIDLSQTRYIDSAGIDMLLRLSDRFDHRRAKLILVIPDTSQLKRLASIVGLSDAIAIHPTLPAALQEAANP
jgi:anti-anti-sigma factor